MQFLDVECTCLSQSLKGAICKFDDVRRQIVSHRMEDALAGVGLPDIALEFITGVAAVHPVLGLMQAAL
jgi:hypothetical protein